MYGNYLCSLWDTRTTSFSRQSAFVLIFISAKEHSTES